MSDLIQPFRIDIPQQQIDDLHQRLDRCRWPDSETVDDWSQGAPLAYVRELSEYWRHQYNWRASEERLNRWPQFITTIDDIDIHFIHARSPHPDALPIIITHGWPGSVVEFYKVIEALIDPTKNGGKASEAFHVVAPSLPGYGFSAKPRTAGTSVERIGRMWGTLMQRLGYSRYVAQGGDWGSMVTQSIAQTESKHCAAIHLNMPIAAPDPETMDKLTEQEQKSLEDMNFYQRWDSAYAKQQSTRPQTLGYGLADSPVGQLAWIIEKFYAWTDCERDGQKHPEHILSRDELLDNVMLYWLNNCAASSARLYWESFASPNMDTIEMPVACSIFPKEIMRCSRRWAEQRFTQLIYWNELSKGGHFAAFEQPELFVNELRKAFQSLR